MESPVGMSEVLIGTVGTFAREVGILPKNDLGLPGVSGGHEVKPSGVMVAVALGQGLNV